MPPTFTNLSPEATRITNLFRSLLVSRPILPARLSELLQDYKELEGERFNLKDTGYSNIIDFLNASGEFNLRKHFEETYISVKPKQSSSHVGRMVTVQKKPRNKTSALRRRLPLQSDQTWNKSSYTSQVYPKLSTSKTSNFNSPARNGSNTSKKRSDGNNNTYTSLKIQTENKQPGPSTFTRSNSYNNGKIEKRPDDDEKPDLRCKLDGKSKSKPDYSTSNNNGTNNSKTRNDGNNNTYTNVKTQNENKQPGPSNFNRTRAQNLQRPVNTNTSNMNSMNGAKTSTQNQFQNRRLHTGTGGNIDNSSHKSMKLSSVQDRLKIRPTNTNTVIEKPPVQPLNEEKSNQTVSPPTVFEFNPKLDAVTSLSQYCVARDFAQPDYKPIKVKYSGAYQCRVLINGEIYSTYPSEFNSMNDAKIACAELAAEQIKNKETRHCFPLCLETDYEIALKIHKELSNHSGFFCKNVPLLFQEVYKQSLPDHWYSIIESTPKLFSTEHIVQNSYLIIYANNQETGSTNSVSDSSDSEITTLDAIELPWDERYWDLYITNPAKTTEVWARLVGKEYSDKFDSLLTDIELEMLTDQIRPNAIERNQIYLVLTEDCWHRVRVVEMDILKNLCKCFFIDSGDLECFKIEELFLCKSSFLKLPPQAILFSLFGLEDFSDNPISKPHLHEMLTSKTLIGEILTRKDTYEEEVESDTNSEAKIKVAFYDTSTEKDINVNPLLMTKICDATPAPALNTKRTTIVNITYIANNGDVFLQLKDGIFYIQRLIHQLVESKFKEDEHKVSNNDLIVSGDLFLIHDVEGNRWARGTLIDVESVGVYSKSLEVFFVDYGCVKNIEMDKIFRLSSLSAALNKFPKQALKVRLNQLPPLNANIIARLRGLLPLDSTAIVKIIVNGTVPIVDVYKHLESNLINVNGTIRIEYELQEEEQVILNEVSSLKLGTEIPNNVRNICTRSPVSLPPSPQRSEYRSLVPFDAAHAINTYFDVSVTMASNPSNFVVQPHEKSLELNDLMKELQIYYENNEEFIPGDMILQGEAYAAIHTDGNYHRVTVENILSPTAIHVHFCDFGDVAVLNNEKLKILPPRFRNLPMLALKAKLFGIKPKDGDWNMEDCLRFRELTVGCQFVSLIKNISSDKILNSRVLELQLIDTATSDDILIHEILIEEGRAIST